MSKIEKTFEERVADGLVTHRVKMATQKVIQESADWIDTLIAVGVNRRIVSLVNASDLVAQRAQHVLAQRAKGVNFDPPADATVTPASPSHGVTVASNA